MSHLRLTKLFIAAFRKKTDTEILFLQDKTAENNDVLPLTFFRDFSL